MPLKKTSTIGAAALQPLDPNQETLSLREAQSQKRKATSPMPHEDELDQEIKNLEMLHQQVQKKKEKMARLADLQRQIDKATEEVCHLAQDEHFIKKDCLMMMDGMMIPVMEILLLMMLILCQQNCRLHPSPRLTSHPSSLCMTDTQIRSSF